MCPAPAKTETSLFFQIRKNLHTNGRVVNFNIPPRCLFQVLLLEM